MLVQRRIAVLFIVLLLIVGCVPQLQKGDTLAASKEGYLEAMKWYHGQAKTYIIWFKAAPPETQDKWRKDITPLFLKAKEALDTWKLFNDQGFIPEDTTIDAFKEVKTKLIVHLSKIEGG